MEQMAASGPRVQLALGRLQLQEQRVNTMIRRFETLREFIAKEEKEVATTQGQLAMMEKMFKTDGVPADDKNPMLGMIEGFKKGIAGGMADVQRLQGEEAAPATDRRRTGTVGRDQQGARRSRARLQTLTIQPWELVIGIWQFR